MKYRNILIMGAACLLVSCLGMPQTRKEVQNGT
jgi:hypothetical protein